MRMAMQLGLLVMVMMALVAGPERSHEDSEDNE